MKTKLIIFIVLTAATPVMAFYSDLGLSGALRNTSYYMKQGGDHNFNNIFEARLIAERETDVEGDIDETDETEFNEESDINWKYYIDGRAYLYYGEIAEDEGHYDFKLMRGFIRYFSSIGDFTLGKTYVNFGNPGLFNPFETDKEVNFSDITYDKEGILALEYDFPIGDISGGKIYIGSDNPFCTLSGGGSFSTNEAGFDFGIVANRLNKDSNIAGAYFKGDLEIGIQGAYGCHFNDDFKEPYNEANAGIDYSFLEGDLIFDTIFYYNQQGALDPEDYRITEDSYLLAKFYLYGSVTYIYDEFLNTQLFCFANLIDGSTMIIPAVNIIIIDGITLTAQLPFLTGKNNQEFSRDIYGDIIALLRIEGKF